ncbi:MAG: DUF692 domain-containing protein [Pseudomonadales bacterium]|nr:DUF692 domain-containing protein [Pseudomonadales bacterium]
MIDFPKTGVGIGLRRALMKPLQEREVKPVDFLEVAPENWMQLGGRLGQQFSWFSDHYPIFCHGLSLSIGSTDKLDTGFVLELKKFFARHHVVHYSEHLSFCGGDGGHLYDLMPMPFTEDAVRHVAARVRQVQDILEQKISLENISYYANLKTDEGEAFLSEAEFVKAVLEEADCYLLLDVNNIYVNSINHRYNCHDFLYSMPAERVSYIHVAGHYDEAEDLKIDTHGSAVKDPVWALLDAAYQYVGVVPTLLERDFNIPPLDEVLAEVGRIRAIQGNIVQQTQRQSTGRKTA